METTFGKEVEKMAKSSASLYYLWETAKTKSKEELAELLPTVEAERDNSVFEEGLLLNFTVRAIKYLVHEEDTPMESWEIARTISIAKRFDHLAPSIPQQTLH